ncbi:hypothetical protein B296_00054835 [Ensete ventricosum]|uniref:Uncharacterized protein n=1 Tax=Ensete ventricosum TaxID=4639 RepID=A0A426XEU7_ENSVE|nr:hypothetical protein B296_00054835 [Ensete ventricosum]
MIVRRGHPRQRTASTAIFLHHCPAASATQPRRRRPLLQTATGKHASSGQCLVVLLPAAEAAVPCYSFRCPLLPLLPRSCGPILPVDSASVISHRRQSLAAHSSSSMAD